MTEWNLNGKLNDKTLLPTNNYTFLINNTITEIYKLKKPHKIS